MKLLAQRRRRVARAAPTSTLRTKFSGVATKHKKGLPLCRRSKHSMNMTKSKKKTKNQ